MPLSAFFFSRKRRTAHWNCDVYSVPLIMNVSSIRFNALFNRINRFFCKKKFGEVNPL